MKATSFAAFAATASAAFVAAAFAACVAAACAASCLEERLGGGGAACGALA